MIQSVDEQLAKSCGQCRPLSLVVSLESSSKQSRIVLSKPYAIVGRHANCDVPLLHAEISKQHVYMQVLDGRLYCVDQGSRKGIRWKDKPRLYGWLDVGEWIQVGPFRITLQEPVGEPDSKTLALRSSTPFAFKYQTTPKVKAHLILNNQQKLPLYGQLATIGKSNYCNLELDAEEISRVHASMVKTSDGKYWLIDLLSRIGVKLNGKRIHSALLKHDDVIKIGNYTIPFQITQIPIEVRPVERATLVDLAEPVIPAVQNQSEEERAFQTLLDETGLSTDQASNPSQLLNSIVTEPIQPHEINGLVGPQRRVDSEAVLLTVDTEIQEQLDSLPTPDVTSVHELQELPESVQGISDHSEVMPVNQVAAELESVSIHSSDPIGPSAPDSIEAEVSMFLEAMSEIELVPASFPLKQGPSVVVELLEEHRLNNLAGTVEPVEQTDFSLSEEVEPILEPLPAENSSQTDATPDANQLKEAKAPENEMPVELNQAPSLIPSSSHSDSHASIEILQDENQPAEIIALNNPEHNDIQPSDDIHRAGQHLVLRRSSNVPRAPIERQLNRNVQAVPRFDSSAKSQLVVKRESQVVPKTGIINPPHVKLSRPPILQQAQLAHDVSSDEFGLMDGLMQYMKQMQQEMMTQMRMNMEMMAEFMHNMQKQQMESIREELGQLGKLNKELLDLRQSLITASQTATVKPQQNEPRRAIRKGTTKPEEKTKGPPEKKVLHKQKLDVPPKPPGKNDNSSPQQSHAWISKRIALLEQERLSRWEKMKTAVMGK